MNSLRPLLLIFAWLLALLPADALASIPQHTFTAPALPVASMPSANPVAAGEGVAPLSLHLDGLYEGRVLVRQNPWSAFDPEGLSLTRMWDHLFHGEFGEAAMNFPLVPFGPSSINDFRGFASIPTAIANSVDRTKAVSKSDGGLSATRYAVSELTGGNKFAEGVTRSEITVDGSGGASSQGLSGRESIIRTIEGLEQLAGTAMGLKGLWEKALGSPGGTPRSPQDVKANPQAPSEGPTAGGGAELDNLSPLASARIQSVANKHNLEISVVGSRAAGTADTASDWDYIIEGGNSKARHSALRELPKNPNANKDGDFRPGSEILRGVKVDPERPHITFKPEKTVSE